MTRQRNDNTENLPPAKSFYEAEGFKLGRANSRGWAMASGNPPCHNSKSGRSFSVNVDHGGFSCFGCGTKGSMFNFVMLRDGCDFKTACKVLGVSREGMSFEERAELARRKQEREWNLARQAEREESERRERLKLRDELHKTASVYHELENRLHEIGPIPAAEPYWAALPPTLDCWRMTESEYCNAAHLGDPYA